MSTQYLAPGTGRDGTQLWVITVHDDGTASAKELVNLYPAKAADGTIGSAFDNNAVGFTPFGHGFIFVAQGSVDETPGPGYGTISGAPAATLTGREFWYTDGTAQGTHLLVDSQKGSGSGADAGVTFGNYPVVNLGSGTALFVTNTGTNQTVLFATNGKHDGTVALTTTTAGKIISNIIALNGVGIFTEFKPSLGGASYLYTTNGTVAGTKADNSGEHSVKILGMFTDANGKQEALFTGDDHKLWETDGTTSTLLSPTAYITSNSNTVIDLGGGKGLVLDQPYNTTYDLIATDGTLGNTQIIHTFANTSAVGLSNKFAVPQPGGGFKEFLTVANTSGTVTQLWVTDGTSVGTTQLATSYAGMLFGLAVGGRLFFNATDRNGNRALEATDGVSVTQVAGFNGGLYAGPAGTVLIESGNQLFITDSTSNGTHQIFAGAPIQHLTVLGDHLLFQAYIGTTWELYGASLSGAATKIDLKGASIQYLSSNFPVLLQARGNEAFLTTYTPDGKSKETWVSDGTQAGTHVVQVAGKGFPLATDGGVDSVSPTSLACFLAGTPILTARGEVAVEDLAVGDLAVTLSGQGSPLKPISWIGRSVFDAARHPHPEQVTPIRIAAGALGDAMPHRDLLVSPGHSLLIDGVLMQAERLVNGATITRDHAITRGTYVHVELPAHDILLSAGAPSESYLDTGNRGAFHGGEVVTLHPDFSAKHWTETCLPLVQGGPVLAAARARLLARATDAGFATTADHGLHVVADGVAVAATRDGRLYRFAIPAGARDVVLASRVWVPAEMEADSLDTRRLGVFVDRVMVDGRPIALDDARLGEGWHGLERHRAGARRWTDGHARLPSGITELAVRLVARRRYWAHAAHAAQAPAWARAA